VRGRPLLSSATSFRRLGRETALYGLGVVLGRAVSFLMLPVYTRFLSPADYGLIALLDLSVDLTAIVFTAGTSAGLQRFYYKTHDEDERRRLISTLFLLTLGLAAFGAIALSALSPAIWKYGLKGAGAPWYVTLAAANFFLGMLVFLPQAVAQTRQKPRFFVSVALAKLVLQLGLNILFIVHFRLGPAGLLWSTFVTCLVLGSVLTYRLFRETGVRLDRVIVRDLRRFGVPYQLTWAGSFLLTFGDRFFLQAGPGITAVGLYGMAYQFGFLLQQIGATPFLNAWNPHRHQITRLPQAERDARYNRGFLYLNLLVVTVAAGIAVLIRPVITLMTTPPFHPAAQLVPVILLAYVAEAWNEAFRFSIDVSEKTRYSTYATWVSVVVVMALYAVLVPLWGPMGAAIATVLGMTLRASLTYRWSRKLWPIAWELARPFRLVLLGGAAGVVAWLIPVQGVVAQGLLGAAIILGYALLTYALVLHADDRALVRQLLRSPSEAWKLATG